MRAATIAAWVTVAAGFALMVVHSIGGADGDPEGWLSAIGFGAPFVGAGVLALVGVRFERPTLCVAAGVALALMSIVSFVMLPLLIPAGFLIAEARHVRELQGSVAVPIVLAVGLVATFALLVFHQDPATWTTPTGGGSSSNIVTGAEAAISVVVTVVVTACSIVWAQTNDRVSRSRA